VSPGKAPAPSATLNARPVGAASTTPTGLTPGAMWCHAKKAGGKTNKSRGKRKLRTFRCRRPIWNVNRRRSGRTVEAVGAQSIIQAPMADHPHTIDRWDDATGENLIEQIAAVGD
jgi:hypothetical protein